MRIPNALVPVASLALLVAAAAGAALPQGSAYVAAEPTPAAVAAAPVRAAAPAEPAECAPAREAAAELEKGTAELSRWINWGKSNARAAAAVWDAAKSAGRESTVTFTPTTCPDSSSYPEFTGADISQFAADISARTEELEPQLTVLRDQLAALTARAKSLGCR